MEQLPKEREKAFQALCADPSEEVFVALTVHRGKDGSYRVMIAAMPDSSESFAEMWLGDIEPTDYLSARPRSAMIRAACMFIDSEAVGDVLP